MIDMEEYRDAILWPANLKEAGPDMPREEADVEENLKFLRINGAVYWDNAAKRKELRGPFEGYIYNTLPIGRVEWKCIIEFVINRDRLLDGTPVENVRGGFVYIIPP
jgi:hypothetical protein